MTEQEKFAKAVELLQESSVRFDMAARLFKDLGVEQIIDQRPIQLEFGVPKWQKVYLYEGVKEIAEIYGTSVIEGRPYKSGVDKDVKYIMTTAEGIVFYQIV